MMGQLLSLSLEQMRHIVKVWKQRQNDDNPDIVSSMTIDTLRLDIKEAKGESNAEHRRELEGLVCNYEDFLCKLKSE